MLFGPSAGGSAAGAARRGARLGVAPAGYSWRTVRHPNEPWEVGGGAGGQNARGVGDWGRPLDSRGEEPEEDEAPSAPPCLPRGARGGRETVCGMRAEERKTVG